MSEIAKKLGLKPVLRLNELDSRSFVNTLVSGFTADDWDDVSAIELSYKIDRAASLKGLLLTGVSDEYIRDLRARRTFQLGY